MKKGTHIPSPILEDELGLAKDEVIARDDQTKIELEAAKLDPSPDKKVFARQQSVHAAPFWKNSKHLALLGLGLLLVTFSILGAISWRNRVANEEFIADQWRGLTQQAELVARTADKATYDNMGDTSRELISLSNKLADIDAQSRKQPSFLVLNSKLNGFRNLTNTLKTYVDEAKQATDKLDEIDRNDLDALQASGSAAESNMKAQKDKLGLAGSLPDNFFTLSSRLDTIIEAHENAENEKQAEADVTKSKEEQARQNQANAEEAVSRWAEAYKKGDVNEMKRWMTAAYTKEYDFSEVTSSYRATNYPVSYRRISTELKGEQYEIVEAITFVTKSDYAADTNYTQTFVFLVSQYATSNRWLVNSRRYSY